MAGKKWKRLLWGGGLDRRIILKRNLKHML
jgi:hypothetical protein